MKLKPICSIRPRLKLLCKRCQQFFVTDDTSRADTDDKAFSAFYCGACAAELEKTV